MTMSSDLRELETFTKNRKEKMMEAGISCATNAAATGAVREMINASNDRVDSARNISQRLRELRVRLVGDKSDADDKAEGSGPAPVRPEIDDLNYTLDVMENILAEIRDNLTALERL